MDDTLLGLHAAGIISRESVECHLKERVRLPGEGT